MATALSNGNGCTLDRAAGTPCRSRRQSPSTSPVLIRARFVDLRGETSVRIVRTRIGLGGGYPGHNDAACSDLHRSARLERREPLGAAQPIPILPRAIT